MEPQNHRIAYKGLAYCLLAAFAFYWIFTLCMIVGNNSMHRHFPRASMAYGTFWRQNWRLFAFTKLYNRELNLLVQDPKTNKTDTFNIVQYSLAQKRKYAPFNNYQDALDHMLYVIMNNLELQLTQKKTILEKQFPGQADSFYQRKAADQICADTKHQVTLNNLLAYARQMTEHEKIDTTGKYWQLELVHIYIPPAKAPAGTSADGRRQQLFSSNLKPF